MRFEDALHCDDHSIEVLRQYLGTRERELFEMLVNSIDKVRERFPGRSSPEHESSPFLNW
jgi:hypothetical protein